MLITKPFKMNNKYKIKRKKNYIICTNSAVIKAVKFIFSLRLKF